MPVDPDRARAIEQLLDWRKQIDPKNSVPVYDLHRADGRHTGYCLTTNEFLDELWRAARHDGDQGPDEMMPHEHLDPSG